jgi:hypothetical protein
VTALVVRRAAIHNGLPFTNANLADRAAATITQAVNLCGSHFAN